MWSVDKRRAYSSFEQPDSPASKDPFHPWTVPQLPTVMPWWASSCFFLIKQVTDCSDHLPRKHILQILEVKNQPSTWLVKSTSHCLISWITHPSLQARTCRYRESAARGVPYWCAKNGARLRSAWSTHKKTCRGRFGLLCMISTWPCFYPFGPLYHCDSGCNVSGWWLAEMFASCLPLSK